MSTFNSPTDAAPITKIRAADINNLDAATAAAFALLPDETRMKVGTVNYGADTGVTNGYVVTLPYPPASYSDGLWIRMRPLNTSTGASTIDVNGLGLKSIKLPNGSATVAGSLAVGIPVDLVYSSATGFFHIMGGLGQQGLPGTEVLPFSDANPHLKGSVDSTKLVRFEVDGLTSATTRVVTIPDKDGTVAMMSDVTAAVAAAVPFSDAAALVKGSGDATKLLRFEVDGITTGTTRTATWPNKDGTVAMTSDTAMTLLATLTPTVAANVDALTTFSSSYDAYLVIGEGLKPSADDALRMRFANAGVVDTASNIYGTSGGGSTGLNSASSSVTLTTAQTSAGAGANFSFFLINANGTTTTKSIHGHYMTQSAATPAFDLLFLGFAYAGTSAVSGLRFYWNVGSNFQATGKIRIYGIVNA